MRSENMIPKNLQELVCGSSSREIDPEDEWLSLDVLRRRLDCPPGRIVSIADMEGITPRKDGRTKLFPLKAMRDLIHSYGRRGQMRKRR